MSPPTSVMSRSLVQGPSASKGAPSSQRTPITALPRRTTVTSSGSASRSAAVKRVYWDASPPKARLMMRARSSSSVSLRLSSVAALTVSFMASARKRNQRARHLRSVFFLVLVSVGGSRGHPLARFGARGADLGAVHEALVARDGPARFFARTAELGARGASYDVVRRPAQHEVRAHLADLRAVEQDADHVHVRVLATFGEAILRRHGADGVAVEALLDAALKLVVLLVVLVIGLVLVPMRMPVAVRHYPSAVDEVLVV